MSGAVAGFGDVRGRARRRALALALAAALALPGAWLLARGGATSRLSTVPDRARRLGASHGLLVGVGTPETFFAPPFGPADARVPGVEATAADAASAAVALDGVERALRQYPPGFVAGLIKAVFVAGELQVGGARAGGTLGPAWILLAAPARLGAEGILATSYLGVHHELSSFVLRKDPATLPAWERLEPSGWRFDEDPRVVIARGQQGDPDPSIGFLSSYGATNPENDFNVYAEKVFTEPAAVRQLAGTHPAVAAKLRFVLEVYTRLDPRLAGVFRELGLP